MAPRLAPSQLVMIRDMVSSRSLTHDILSALFKSDSHLYSKSFESEPQRVTLDARGEMLEKQITYCSVSQTRVPIPVY